MTIIESQEPIHRQLRSQPIILSRKHLLSHTCPNLGLEIENGAETEITSFTALIVLGVLDASTTTNGRHTGVNIFVQVQTFLGFRDAAASVHVDGV